MSPLKPKPAGTISGIPSITRYCYGDVTPKLIRRVRHQIDNYGLPVLKRGRLVTSFPDWLDAWLRGRPVPRQEHDVL